jgi:hypothetical protein
LATINWKRDRAGSGPLFRLAAHCLCEEASPREVSVRFAQVFDRENALPFFFYTVARL